MTTNPDLSKLRVNRHSATDRKPNQEAPGCWWFSPGFFTFFVMVHTALLMVARERGWDANRIEFIRVANVEGDPILWIWPTDEKDPDRIPLRHYRGHLSANLSTVMINWGLALPRGQRNRHDVLTDEARQSPVGPALYISMNKVLESKWEKKGASRPAAPATE